MIVNIPSALKMFKTDFIEKYTFFYNYFENSKLPKSFAKHFLKFLCLSKLKKDYLKTKF